eukprot:5836538-Pleurochrysis_carterae.AAC.1
MSASYYSAANLAAASHDHELHSSGAVHVHLDVQHMGVGGHDSWTKLATVGADYYVSPRQNAAMSLRLMPMTPRRGEMPDVCVAQRARPILTSGAQVLLRAVLPQPLSEAPAKAAQANAIAQALFTANYPNMEAEQSTYSHFPPTAEQYSPAPPAGSNSTSPPSAAQAARWESTTPDAASAAAAAATERAHGTFAAALEVGRAALEVTHADLVGERVVLSAAPKASAFVTDLQGDLGANAGVLQFRGPDAADTNADSMETEEPAPPAPEPP